MSYFMTISKASPTGDFAPMEFLEISKAQAYLAKLESDLLSLDGSPIYFVHDGSTGTSHEILSEAERFYPDNGTIKGALLWKLIEYCAQVGATLRIWWASDDPNSYRTVVTFHTLEEIRKEIEKRIGGGGDIALRFQPSG